MARREGGERRRKLSLDEEVGVEGVLDDEDSRGGRGRDELAPARRGGEEARRVLEVGDRVEELRPLGEGGPEGLGLGSLRVERDAEEAGAVRAEERERPRVARALDRDGVPRVDEGACDQVEPLLGAVDDEERVGVRRDAAPLEPGGESLAERPVAERRAVREEGAVSRDLREDLRERLGRELLLLGGEPGEVVRDVRRPFLRGDLREYPAEERGGDPVPRRGGADHRPGERPAGDPRAAALVRLDPSVALEDLERLVDGGPVHLVGPGESPGSREPRALLEPPAPDVADDSVRDRPVERYPAGRLLGMRGEASRASSPWREWHLA